MINSANINQIRHVSAINPIHYGTVELDSHADTTCVGKIFKVISYTDRVCEVSPYHPSYKSLMNVPIVQAATAHDDAETGETFILIFNECLHLWGCVGKYINEPQPS